MASKIYIAVTIIYIIIKYIRDIILLKYITKRGYKFSNPYKQINKFLMNLLILFIPFIRTIFITKKIIVLFNLNKYINIISNKIVLLSEKEKVKVKNNFSLFCILKINFSNEIMTNSLIVYMENNEENIIYYTILNNKKVIVSSKGPVSRLSKKKQLKKLEEQLKEIDLIKNPLKNHINNISINNTNILNRKTTTNMYFSSLNNFN